MYRYKKHRVLCLDLHCFGIHHKNQQRHVMISGIYIDCALEKIGVIKLQLKWT